MLPRHLSPATYRTSSTETGEDARGKRITSPDSHKRTIDCILAFAGVQPGYYHIQCRESNRTGAKEHWD